MNNQGMLLTLTIGMELPMVGINDNWQQPLHLWMVILKLLITAYNKRISKETE